MSEVNQWMNRTFMPEGINTLDPSEEKRRKQTRENAGALADEPRRIAEEKALLEAKKQDEESSARKALLAKPVSGFGPNTNLARTFLTSL